MGWQTATGVAVILCSASLACAPPPASEQEIVGVVESFYAAIKNGDNAAAMKLVAPDAMFIESGGLETRDQYEANHLPSDIEFEQQVSGTRRPAQVRIEGDVAWVIATTEYEGSFSGRPVSFVSAQLAVLSRTDEGWRIRSIHWSSRPR